VASIGFAGKGLVGKVGEACECDCPEQSDEQSAFVLSDFLSEFTKHNHNNIAYNQAIFVSALNQLGFINSLSNFTICYSIWQGHASIYRYINKREHACLLTEV
jgi:hypothetical protein